MDYRRRNGHTILPTSHRGRHFPHLVRRGKHNHTTEAPRYLELYCTFSEPSVQEGAFHLDFILPPSDWVGQVAPPQASRPGRRYHMPEALQALDTHHKSGEPFVREEAFYLERILSGEM